jgi:hypothetical protein
MDMTTTRTLYLSALGVVSATLLALPASRPGDRALAAQATQPASGVISGTVTGASGPEAGVWVIAETRDLPTRYAKIVVTDDRGRYVIPELPNANYDVWVRGYGLVDSPHRRGRPGQTMNLRAVAAPNAAAAAEYYPAGYWYSLMRVPPPSEFPGTGPEGNGISPNVRTQAQYVRSLKSGGCTGCHAMGNKATRQLPPSLGKFPTSVDAWHRRIQSGQAGAGMLAQVENLGRQGTLSLFADWTDRIAKGELPPVPKRPQGVERNVVITMWDWADPKAYLHDLVSTDRRKPTVNANGRIYGALELSADYMPVLDPLRHTATKIPIAPRDPNTPATGAHMPQPSPYYGWDTLWTSKVNVHNGMFDERGRLWLAATVRGPENPAFCKAGSDHPSAKLTPVERAGRHLAMYDPQTKKLTHIATCFGTHHVMFAEDANHTLWTSGGAGVVGWLNRKMFDETGDEEKSQGWTALIVDANGNGRRDEHVEANQPLDPTKDKRIAGGFYAASPAPDGSVWGSQLGFPGAVVRLVPGSNPPHTALAEYYQPPFDHPDPAKRGYSPRGMDVDRNGVAWVALASGHLASFDRRKCQGPLKGPTAVSGQHCREGWTLYTEPLPQMQGVADATGSAEGSYYTWVDQFNTFGLGTNVPINTGNASEGLLVLHNGQWVVLRVPYPLGFYAKWLDGRIDDPNAGWKGRGLWATVSTRAPFHMEGGRGNTSKVFKFQLRPDPLAR